MAIKFDENGYPVKDKWYDSLWFGSLLAIALPIITLLILISKELPQLSLNDMFDYAWKMTAKKEFLQYLTSSLLPNMFLFMMFYVKELWKSCRGCVVFTLLFFALYIFRGFI